MVILGCGYVGQALARAKLAQGEPVAALTRNTARAAELRALGVSPVVVADMAAVDWHSALNPAGADIVNCVSPSSPDEEGYRQAFLAGHASVRRWLEFAAAGGGAPPRSIVLTSSTAVYPQTDGCWVDEDTPVEIASLGPAGRVLYEAEAQWLAMAPGLARRAWVLRLGGIYGPGRHHLLDALREGEMSFPGDGSHWINLIHRDDVVGAILACLDAPTDKAGGIYNVVDNEPVRKSDLVAWLANQLGHDPARVQFGARGTATSPHRRTASGVVSNRRISSAKLQKSLGFKTVCHSYKDGYGRILNDLNFNPF